MAILILLGSFTLATLFGVGSIFVLGDGIATSTVSTAIFFSIIIFGIVMATMYETLIWLVAKFNGVINHKVEMKEIAENKIGDQFHCC